MAKNKNNQAIWNTRIKKKASSLFQKVGNSIDIDKRLYKEVVLENNIAVFADFAFKSASHSTIPKALF